MLNVSSDKELKDSFREHLDLPDNAISDSLMEEIDDSDRKIYFNQQYRWSINGITDEELKYTIKRILDDTKLKVKKFNSYKVKKYTNKII